MNNKHTFYQAVYPTCNQLQALLALVFDKHLLTDMHDNNSSYPKVPVHYVHTLHTYNVKNIHITLVMLIKDM